MTPEEINIMRWVYAWLVTASVWLVQTIGVLVVFKLLLEKYIMPIIDILTDYVIRTVRKVTGK